MFAGTLQVYIFSYLIKIFLFLCLAISSIIFLVDFSELTNRLSGIPDYTTQFGLTLSLLRIPFILQVALPFIVLAATMTTLIQLNRKNELVIARSIGVSAWQFLRPIWFGAFLIGCLIAFGFNAIAAHSFSKATELEANFRGAPSDAGLLTNSRPWLRQDAEDGGFFLIGAERSVGNANIVLFEASFIKIDATGDISMRYDAARSRLDNGQWVLREVAVSKAGTPTRIIDRFTIPTSLDPSVVTEALVSPEMISFWKLGEQIDIARSFGVSAAPFRMQYHSLIALPVLLISMTLVAASVSLRFVRFGQSASLILGGIVAGFVLYVITEVAKSFGGAGIIPPIVAAWLPIFAAGMFGVAYLLHREDG